MTITLNLDLPHLNNLKIFLDIVYDNMYEHNSTPEFRRVLDLLNKGVDQEIENKRKLLREEHEKEDNIAPTSGDLLMKNTHDKPCSLGT